MTDLEQQNLGERIGVLENEVKNIKEQNTTEHAEIKTLIKDFIEQADKKYAPAWIGTFVYAIIILLVSALVGGAISTLFK